MVSESTPKDVVHAIRNCSVAKEVWSKLIPVEKQGRFFSRNLKEWLESNLGNYYNLSVKEVEWQYFFSLIVWHIWKN